MEKDKSNSGVVAPSLSLYLFFCPLQASKSEKFGSNLVKLLNCQICFPPASHKNAILGSNPHSFHGSLGKKFLLSFLQVPLPGQKFNLLFRSVC